LIVRAAGAGDRDAIWSILEPVIRAGEVFALDRGLGRDVGLAYWFTEGHEVFVAEDGGAVVGSYYLRTNQRGGGSHVANCGYMTASAATGKGVARTMCEHSLEWARSRGFKAMQFNFVIESNERAVRLWQSCGFAILCRLPKAFLHPQLGYVDAFVMFREL
jgi:GNAT superfamily N-acetyltransferase